MTDAEFIINITRTTNNSITIERLQDIARRLEDDEWQPIETAPRNESWLLLWEQYSNVPFVGCWSNSRKNWTVSHEHISAKGGWDGAIVVDCISMPVTHWKPLPKEPK